MINEREQASKKIVWIALIANILLMIGKIVFGLIGDSEAVFADGIHSAADVIASIAVLAVIRISNKPPDKEHPFGHGKAEVIVEGFVGIILVMVSIYILSEAILTCLNSPKAPEYIALITAFLSYIVKEVLYRTSIKQSEKWNSKAIKAIAYDHKGDIIASLAASLGVFIAIMGEKYNIHYLLYADSMASILVAYLILKIALELIKPSLDILMEKSVGEDLIKEYENIVYKFEEVKRIDKIRAREHGHYILVDVRLSLEHDLTIKEGHDIIRKIRDAVQKEHPNVEEVLIHINPYYNN